MIYQFDKKKRVLFFPTGWANSVASWCAGVSSPTGTIRIKNTLTPKEGGVSLEIDINEERIASLALQAIKNRTSFSDAERNLIKGMFQGATDQKVLVYRNDLFGIDMDALRRNLGLGDEEEGLVKLQENKTDNSTSGESYDISTPELLAEKAPEEDVATSISLEPVPPEEIYAEEISRIGVSHRAAREDHKHPVCKDLGSIPLFRGGETVTSSMPSDELPTGLETFPDAWSLGNEGKFGFKMLVVSRITYDEEDGIHYLFFREASVSKNGNFTAVGAELGATAIMA